MFTRDDVVEVTNKNSTYFGKLGVIVDTKHGGYSVHLEGLVMYFGESELKRG